MRPKYYVKQEKFEGPLDLLLELITKEKLPINEISLSSVTEEYLAEVKKMETIDQEALAEFLVIAAQLMLLKSRSLLPHLALSEEEEESISDLERRLQEYAKIKELAKELKFIESRGNHIFSREPYLGLPVVFYPPPGLRAGVLAFIFQTLLAAIPAVKSLAEEKIKRVISLEEKIREIQSLLTAKVERVFSDIIKGSKEKIEVVVSFLAILELAKQKLISLHQDEAFNDIMIRANSHEKP
ncbi:MAG: segregation/condensation protein A [Candidatus Sungbacteria bacterium]|nr:segregation/condensation protein A [Candidatus Sungbacteria bacterium]